MTNEAPERIVTIFGGAKCSETEPEYEQARLRSDTDAELARQGLVADLTLTACGCARVRGEHCSGAALAALMLHVAVRMSEGKHILHILKVAPRTDIVVLVTCFSLTVLFDMVVAVTAGIVLASILFMERMAAVSRVSLVSSEELDLDRPLPPNLLLYEIAGPLFFGAAQRAMTAVRAVAKSVRVVVLELRAVPLLDATGLVALDSSVTKLREAGIFVVLAGVQTGPLRVLAKAGWRNREGELAIGTSFDKALALALAAADAASAAQTPPSSPPPPPTPA